MDFLFVSTKSVFSPRRHPIPFLITAIAKAVKVAIRWLGGGCLCHAQPMTPIEATLAAQASFSNALTLFAIHLSVISGYVIIAHFVGKDLTRWQVAIVNGLYLIMVLMDMTFWYAFMRTGLKFTEALIAEQQGLYYDLIKTSDLWGTAMGAILALSALLFMWIVRRQGVGAASR